MNERESGLVIPAVLDKWQVALADLFLALAKADDAFGDVLALCCGHKHTKPTVEWRTLSVQRYALHDVMRAVTKFQSRS